MEDALQLDEAQGLLPEMVRGKLEALGYPLRDCPDFPVCKSLGQHTHHGKNIANDVIVPDVWAKGCRQRREVLRCTIGIMAARAGISVQEQLRDINPRCRPGVPSEEAISAHHGPWMMRDGYGNPRIGWFEKRHSEAPWMWYMPRYKRIPLEKLDRCHFWSCNVWGDKTRWPEKDGVVLW